MPISVLGVLTIIGYGACYYAYGVLIGPIRTDTGWPDAALGAIFSAALVISGAGGIVAGRVLDRCGPRPGFLVAGIAGAGAMLAASVQGALLPFAVAYAGGCGLVGALGFYHITQAAAARTAPAAPARAIIWVTLFGALSSPVYLPLTAWLTSSAGWRATIRIEAGTVAVAFVLAAVLIKNPDGSQPGPPGRAPGRSAPGRLAKPAGPGVAGRHRDGRGSSERADRLPGPGHHPGRAPARHRGGRRRVPRPGPASRAAPAHRPDRQARRPCHSDPGLRPGRGGHAAAVRRWRAGAGAGAASLLAGAAIGAVYTLQGVYAYELIDPGHLGTLLGIGQAVFAGGGALGPIAVGVLLGATGSYLPAVTIISAGFAAAAGVTLLGRAPDRARPATPPPDLDCR